MPAVTMQERLAAIVAAGETEPPRPDYLRVITPDLQECPIPSLSNPEAQKEITRIVSRCEIDLMIIDSISTLCASVRSAKENDAESWAPLQEWALALRRQGVSVLFVHHAGKAGAQRGTSKREDILDTSISLRRPQDYGAEEGARFEVHLEKARGVFGDAAAPFEARLEIIEKRANWTTRSIEDVQLVRVAALLSDGCKPPEIAKELGVSRSTFYRLRKDAEKKGLLS
jgi:putative DNA primase/helicase